MAQDDITACPDCGFQALSTQFAKTKGKCPRCNPEESKKYIKRKAFVLENSGEAIPAELK